MRAGQTADETVGWTVATMAASMVFSLVALTVVTMAWTALMKVDEMAYNLARLKGGSEAAQKVDAMAASWAAHWAETGPQRAA